MVQEEHQKYLGKDTHNFPYSQKLEASQILSLGALINFFGYSLYFGQHSYEDKVVNIRIFAGNKLKNLAGEACSYLLQKKTFFCFTR